MVGKRFGLARRAGQAEVFGQGQRKDRGIAACPVAVELGLQNARRELLLCIGHRITDLCPELFNGLRWHRFDQFNGDDRDSGGRV